MEQRVKEQRTCDKGHRYFKSTECPTCPICEAQRKPAAEFMEQLSAPARRALEAQGIDSLQKLSQYSERELLKLHGLGPASLPKLRTLLASEHLSFRATK